MKKNLIFSALSILFLWLVWIIAYDAVRNDYLLPSFWETFRAMGKLFADGSFWSAFFGTFLRTVISFLIAFMLGAAFAALSCLHGGVRAFLSPLVSVLRTVPTMAVILILLLWTNAFVAPVIVTLLVIFPALYSAMLASIDEVRGEYGALAQAFGVPAGRRLFSMYLPLCAPNVLSQAGGILSMGLKITVSGEVLSQTYRSLGGMMQNAQLFLEMPTLLALTVLVVVLGFLLEGLGLLFKKILIRWRT